MTCTALTRALLRTTLALACLTGPLPALGAAQDSPLTVMSFNIRYGTARDGVNSWAMRRDGLFDVVRQQDADVIGLQEALDFQIDEILAGVPVYAALGVGRDDGIRKGEYAAILFRRDRFHVAATGTFWLSDTPGVVGSSTWGNRITRICTWARLVDRDGRAFWIYNVHLDHESQPSRVKSVDLLRQRIDARPSPNEPVVVTGDFNAGETNEALRALTAGGAFLDTFRVTHPDEPVAGTFTGFRVGSVNGDKIDYVFVQPRTRVLSASIVRTARNGRYPSDHFPVVARIVFARSP